MSVKPKSPQFTPLYGDEGQSYRNLDGATAMQSVLRWASVFLVVFPAFVLGLVLYHIMTWVLFPPVLLACGMIIMNVLINRHGDTRMWWLWRGPILTPELASDTYEAQCWLKAYPDQSVYCEITTGCFKFKKLRHARLFQLHWC